MAYVTNAEIEERLGTTAYVQLTDDAGSGSADLDKVDEARRGAEGEVESYLARRVSVPVDVSTYPEASAVVKSLVLDLVEYRLHSRRPPVSKDVARRRNEAVRWLERFARGEVLLPTASEVPPNAAGGITGEVIGPAREWTRETMKEL